MVSPSGAGAQASPPSPLDRSRSVEPELCRVSVLAGRTQVDLALPADVPIASLLPELASLLLRNQFGEPERVPDDLTARWTLGRVGHDPLDDSHSLLESGIVDGDLLVLRSDMTTELPTVYDDVIDAVAGITRREFHSWTAAAARWVGVAAFMASVAAGVAMTLVASWSDTRIELGAIAFVAFVVFFVADILVRNNGGDRVVCAALSVASAAAVFTGCFAVLPGSENAANVLLGAGVATLVGVVAMRVTTGDPFSHLALVTITALVTIDALIQVLAGWAVRDTAAIIAVVGLVLALVAPRLTILLVRLPLPSVPAAGTPLDDVDPPDQTNVNAGVAAIGAVALPETTALELRAKAANAYMSGLMLGAAAVAVTGAVMVAVPRPGFYWQGFVLGLLVAFACVLRGRSHTDLVQAAGMIGIGAAGLVTVLGTQMVAGGVWTTVSVGLVVLFSALAFAFGAITPSMEFSPVVRRIGEILEYLVIAATVPLAAWVVGLYSLARGGF
ncbi:type VII secretion integral membrane protein EccD [Williamsia sp. SKLECPSW1]